MSFKRILTIIGTCLLVSAFATLSVFGYAEHQRAEDTQARYTETEVELTQTKIALAETQADRDEVDRQLEVTSRSLDRTEAQAETLSRQSTACRYLIRVNDHLLFGAAAYADATSHLLKKDNAAAKQDIQTAARYARAVQTTVTNSGHRNISTLVNACAPPQLTR